MAPASFAPASSAPASSAPAAVAPRPPASNATAAGSDLPSQLLAGLKASGAPELRGLGWGAILVILLVLAISQAQNLAVVGRWLKALLQGLWRGGRALRRWGRRFWSKRPAALRPSRPGDPPALARPQPPGSAQAPAATPQAPSTSAPSPPAAQPPLSPRPVSRESLAPPRAQSLAPPVAAAAVAPQPPAPARAPHPAAGGASGAVGEPCRDNPFGDRGRISDPRRFFDREELLRDIFAELRKGSSLSLVGESQIGKSSLLAMVRHQGPTVLADTGQTFLTIDMQTIQDMDEFFEELCRELQLGQTLRGQPLKRALGQRQVVVCLDEIEKMTHPQAFSWQQRAELRGLAEGAEAPLSLGIASR